MGADATKIQKEEQKKIDEAQPLSEEEQAEKEVLLTKVCFIKKMYQTLNISIKPCNLTLYQIILFVLASILIN